MDNRYGRGRSSGSRRPGGNSPRRNPARRRPQSHEAYEDYSRSMENWDYSRYEDLDDPILDRDERYASAEDRRRADDRYCDRYGEPGGREANRTRRDAYGNDDRRDAYDDRRRTRDSRDRTDRYDDIGRYDDRDRYPDVHERQYGYPGYPPEYYPQPQYGADTLPPEAFQPPVSAYPAWGVPPYGAAMPPYYSAPYGMEYAQEPYAAGYSEVQGQPEEEYDELTKERDFSHYMGEETEPEKLPEAKPQRTAPKPDMREEFDNSDYAEKRREQDVLFTGKPVYSVPEQPEEEPEGFDDDFDDDFDDPVGSVSSTRPIMSTPVEDVADDLSEFDFQTAQPPRDGYEDRPVYRENREKAPEYSERPPARLSEDARYTERKAERRKPEPPAPPRMSARRPAIPDPPAPVRLTTQRTRVIALAAVVMCLLAAWLVSAGDLIVLRGISKEQRSATFDITMGTESLTSNVKNGVKGLPKIYTLPMSESPASTPLASGFSTYVDEDGDTHDTYTDETITVDCSRKKYTVDGFTVIAAVAKVKIAHPTQLRSAFAGGEFSSTKRDKLSNVGKAYNAIVGINGELYNYAGKDGTLIRNGTVYRSNPKVVQVLYIDSNGDFHIHRGYLAENDGTLSGYKIYQTVEFGPALVIDGIVQEEGNDIYGMNARNPRSAIGQTGTLEYVLVAVEGRSANSKGLGIISLGRLMSELGCSQAYNVDGGQSSVMVYNGATYSNVSNGGERLFSDMIYFGSALPEE